MVEAACCKRYKLILVFSSDDCCTPDTRNRVLIPSGSRVEDEFRPVKDGVQFVARRLVLKNGETYRIDATSRIIYSYHNFDAEDLRNTRISDAARIIISSVLGNDRITRDDSNLIVVYPDRDLDLRFTNSVRLYSPDRYKFGNAHWSPRSGDISQRTGKDQLDKTTH